MSIILKFVIRSIKERKARAALVIAAIMLSATLLFVSVSLSNTLVDMYKDRMSQLTGTAELLITNNVGNRLMDKETLEDISENYLEETNYMIGAMNYTGKFKEDQNSNKEISLLGIQLDDLNEFNKIDLLEKSFEDEFTGDEIILSKNTCDKYDLNLGDKVSVRVSGEYKELKVSGIAKIEGLFLDESEKIYSVVPFDTLNEYLGVENKYNTLYTKTSSNTSIDELKTKIEADNEDLEAKEPFTVEEIETQVNRIATPLLLITIVLTLMSAYIIYSTFKVITKEKMSIVGTFRSIGATKLKSNQILILESLFYGVVGGVFACALGIAVLYIISYLSIPSQMRDIVKVNMEFSPLSLVFIVIGSIILCVVSSLVPILKVSLMSIKDIIFNNVKEKFKKGNMTAILGIIFVILGVTVPRYAPTNLLLIVSMLSVIMAIVGIVFLAGPVLNLITKILQKITANTRLGVINVALNNIRNNQNILNSIKLLTIGIATLLMINTVSTSVSREVLNFYENIALYDLDITMNIMDEETVDEIKNMKNVESVMPVYQGKKIEVSDKNDSIALIESVDKTNFADYWNIVFYEDKDELFTELESGDNIILTTILRDRYNLEEGDEITLNYNDEEKAFKVIGFVYTLNSNGSYALMSEESMKSFFGFTNYADIYINTTGDSAVEEFKDDLSEYYADEEPIIYLKSEVTNQKMSNNKQLFSILSAVSILALIIGAIGISNNQIISFIERKKNLAILRSIGMSKKQMFKMILSESIMTGIIGGLIGDLAGYIMISIVPYVMKAIKLPIPVHTNYSLFVTYALGALAIIVISAVIPMIRSKKLSIIESIKYE